MTRGTNTRWRTPLILFTIGDGVWVVKSRSSYQKLHQSQKQAQQQPQLPYVDPSQSGDVVIVHKKHEKLPTNPIVCEQLTVREGSPCNIPETCLQPNFEDTSSYLQCNPVTRKWVKKFCQPNFWFAFEHQSCVGHAGGATRTFRQHARKSVAHQQPMHAYPNNNGVMCTYAQCSPSNPCNMGTCNNGYCCSSTAGTGAMMGVPMTTAPAVPTAPAPRRNRTLSLHSYLSSPANDWVKPSAAPQRAPVPMPPELGALDALLVRATGDGSSCAAGFTSAIPCVGRDSGACPAGLFCDQHIRMCCPLLLPLKEVVITSTHPPTTTSIATTKGRVIHHHYPPRLENRFMGLSAAGSPTNSERRHMHSLKHHRPMSSFPCPRCNQFYSYACPNGASPYGQCSGGMCASGYQCMPSVNLCCPTQPQLAPSLPQRYSSCPAGSSGSGACVSGQCSPGYSCNSNNVCCAQVVPATVCPDGTQAAGACVNNMCGAGFTCNQGLCCTNSSQTPRCLDGSQAIGACMQGKCGSGYTCTTGNICCPSTLNACPNGQASIGSCVNGRCPDGYTCINNQCCGPPTNNNAASTATCVEADSQGPCLADGNCPEPGYACDTANNWCCPQIVGNAVGPCIPGEGGTRLCPEGYACSGTGVGQCFRLNTGTCAPEDQFGPCGANNTCTAGYTCVGGFCCRNGTFRRRKRASFLIDYFNH